MARREREILEHAVRTVAEQAVKADELVDEAKAAGGGDHPVTVHAKMLRLELLKVKAFIWLLLTCTVRLSFGEDTYQWSEG